MAEAEAEVKKANVGFLREGFMVRRYHTAGHVAKEETVGHHTCNVLAILFHLFDDAPPLYLIRHALHHDAAEVMTGDIPATAKWKFPALAKAAEEAEAQTARDMGLEIKELDPLHRDLLKYADMMDLCFKSVEELTSGNEAFQHILGNGLTYCMALLEGSLKEYRQAHELMAILASNNFIDIASFIEETSDETKH
jgi:5'-deoxynucleotidase YfbR-like HD superfamily hydrolase